MARATGKNQVFQSMLKDTTDLIRSNNGISYGDIKSNLESKYGSSHFTEMKPFVKGILYKTARRPSREAKQLQASSISIPYVPPTSSIAHIVNTVCNIADGQGISDMDSVWSKLAISRSARDFATKNSTTAGFSSDGNLLPQPVLFCQRMTKEQEEELVSLSVILDSFDQIARVRTKSRTSGLQQVLAQHLQQSQKIVGMTTRQMSEFVSKISVQQSAGGGAGGLWRSPTKGDDHQDEGPFHGAIINSRYVLTKYLASGSYKTCWKAHDLRTENSVCLAVPKGAHEAEGFQRELLDGVSEELAVSRSIFGKGLRHIGMVNILDVSEASKPKTIQLKNNIRARIHFIVMDLCVADLHAYLGFEKGEMPEQLSRNFFEQLLECLVYLHERNRFHLDIKLDNVMVVFTDSTFRLKLIDFTRMTDGTSPIVHNSRVGLNSHCAPEARPKGARYSGAKQDMWSCGRLLLRMVTPVENMIAIQSWADDRPIEEVLTHLQSENVHFTKELNEFLIKVMAMDPDERPTAKEALQMPWINGRVAMNGPAVVAEMERRSPMERTESQTQAVEWDRTTPLDSVLRTIEKFVSEMGKTCTVKNQVIVEYAERNAGGGLQTITVVCEAQHKRLLVDTNTEEWVSSSDPLEDWKEFDSGQNGRMAWLHNKTRVTQWDKPEYSEVFGTRVMLRWKLGSSAALWLAFVAKVGGGLHRIYCDLAAVKSSMRRTVIDVLKKLRCAILSGYLVKSNDTHNQDAVSSTLAAVGRLLAYKSKLEALTLTHEGDDSEDMRIIEHIAVVLSAEGTSPGTNKVAQRKNWKLRGGSVAHGAFQLLTRDQSALANAFKSTTGEPMNRLESEEQAMALLDCDSKTMLRPVKKLFQCLTRLQKDASMYESLDQSKFAVRLRPGPFRNRIIWLHQILVTLVRSLPFDDGKAKSFIEFLPETEEALADENLFAPNIEWPSDRAIEFATFETPREQLHRQNSQSSTRVLARPAPEAMDRIIAPAPAPAPEPEPEPEPEPDLFGDSDPTGGDVDIFGDSTTDKDAVTSYDDVPDEEERCDVDDIFGFKDEPSPAAEETTPASPASAAVETEEEEDSGFGGLFM